MQATHYESVAYLATEEDILDAMANVGRRHVNRWLAQARSEGTCKYMVTLQKMPNTRLCYVLSDNYTFWFNILYGLCNLPRSPRFMKDSSGHKQNNLCIRRYNIGDSTLLPHLEHLGLEMQPRVKWPHFQFRENLILYIKNKYPYGHEEIT